MNARRAARQRGMSLVMALFVIVVLGMFSVFAVRIGASGDQDIGATLLQERVLAAARSGIEYGAYRALVAGNCGVSGALVNFPSVTLTQGALNGFTVAVSCRGWQHTHKAGFYWTYDIDATAQKGTYGAVDYVRRKVSKTVTVGPPP